jgi:polygalacturonase
MKSSFLAGGFAVLGLALLAFSGCVAPSLATKRYVISDLGAVADGRTVNTKSIQAAIDRCSTEGGGVLVVPKGVFVSGALFFKPKVSLLVEKDGVLKGTLNQDDYPQVPTRWEGTEREWTSAFLNFFDVSGIVISGEGTVDGSGDEWTARAPRRTPGMPTLPSDAAVRPAPSQPGTDARSGPTAGARRGRPRLIALQNCRDVRVSGLHLKNQASWGLFMVYCEAITAENLVIRAEHNIPSSDGMDIDSCRKVHVIGCDIDVNDDCISIKSGKDEDGRRVNRPAEDILIEKVRFAYGHGGVAMGSEVSGGIRRIEVRDCVVEAGNWAPIRFKSQPSRGGVVEDITYRNIDIREAKQAFEFDMEWRMVPPIAPASDPLTVVRNVKLINVSGTATIVGKLHGLKGSPITGVKFVDCHVTATKGLLLENTADIDTSGLHAEVKEGDAIIRR